MTSLKLAILFATVCLLEARIIVNDPGPHPFGYNTPPSPPLDLNNGEVMMKDAILFLTPTQIKIYEASQGQNPDLKTQVSEEEIQRVASEIKRQLAQQNIFAIDKNSTDKPMLLFPNLPKPVIEEPVEDFSINKPLKQEQNWAPLQQEEQKFFFPSQNDNINYNYKHKPAESYSYIKFFTEHEVHETPKMQLFHPVPQEQKVQPELEKFLEEHTDPLYNKKYKLIPYDYKALEVPSLDELKQITKLTSLLEKYEKSNTENDQLTEFPKIEENKYEQFQKESTDLGTQFEDQKNNEEAKEFMIKIEKENAKARAEAILNSTPPARKETKIKRRPLTSNKPRNPQHSKDWNRRFIPLDSAKDFSHVWKH